MRIKLDARKSLHENAARYYEEAKAIRKKIKGLEKAIEESERELKKAREEGKKREAKVRIKRKKEWYEKFRYFFTESGLLAIGGRNAKQNEILFSRYLEKEDLFFHADIQGAPALILKKGKCASEEELKEAAQFAASYSSAWKIGAASVDVYAVEKTQVSRHAHGGFVPSGGFAIFGKRRWFRGIHLGLKIGLKEGKLVVLPESAREKLEKEILIQPGGIERGKAAREIGKKVGVDFNEVLLLLPSGKIEIR